MNDTKRRAIVKQLFDEVTNAAYIVPLVAIPRIWVHSKDLEIWQQTDPFFGYGGQISYMGWK